MLEYLQELLIEIPALYLKNAKQKKIALETAIEILEKLRNEERRCKNAK